MAAYGWGADPDGQDATTPPARRSQKAVRGSRRAWRLLCTSGLLRVRACPLCSALTLDERQHAAVHAADVRRTDPGPTAPR